MLTFAGLCRLCWQYCRLIGWTGVILHSSHRGTFHVYSHLLFRRRSRQRRQLVTIHRDKLTLFSSGSMCLRNYPAGTKRGSYFGYFCNSSSNSEGQCSCVAVIMASGSFAEYSMSAERLPTLDQANQPEPIDRYSDYIHHRHLLLTTQSKSWYSVYHPAKGRRLSRPSWLASYYDGLPARRQSPIQVLTRPVVE